MSLEKWIENGHHISHTGHTRVPGVGGEPEPREWLGERTSTHAWV